MEEELHKMGVTINEEEELRQIKSVDVNDPELNKELEKLLSQPSNEDYLEDDIQPTNGGDLGVGEESKEEDLSDMLSSLAIKEETTPKATSPISKEKEKQPVPIQNIIQDQIGKCLQAIEFYTKKGLKEKRTLFEKRLDALIKDLSDNIDISVTTKVKIGYEVEAPIIESISDNELVIACKNLDESGKFRIGVTFEFYSDYQTKQINASNEPISLKIKRNDVRTIKFFEHRRIRIQLLEAYTYWLILTGYRTVETTTVKLDTLLKENTCEVQVNLGGKAFKLLMALRRPILANLSGNYLKKNEIWQIPNTGRSAGLYTEIPLKRQVPLVMIPLEEIKSYNGLEYEINQIPKDTSDATLKDRLFLLEAQRDMLNLQVQMGSLSPEQYAKQLEKERSLMKNRAVEWRNKGNKDWARQYLLHMKLIEKEIHEMAND